MTFYFSELCTISHLLIEIIIVDCFNVNSSWQASRNINTIEYFLISAGFEEIKSDAWLNPFLLSQCGVHSAVSDAANITEKLQLQRLQWLVFREHYSLSPGNAERRVSPTALRASNEAGIHTLLYAGTTLQL